VGGRRKGGIGPRGRGGMRDETYCRACGRRIPRARLFCMIDRSNAGIADVAVCLRCMENSSQLRAMLVRNCAEQWHDLYDHSVLCRWKRNPA